MPLFWGQLIAAGISAWASNRAAKKQAEALANDPAVAAQTRRLEQGTRLRGELEALVKSMAQGGPPPVFHLGTRRGEGSDIEALMSGIASNAEFNKLLQVLNAGEGPQGAATTSLQGRIGIGNEQRRSNEDLISALLMLGINHFGSGGSGGGSSAALPPPGTGATDF